MFGSTEMMELLRQSTEYFDFQYGIVPTVLLPLAFLSTGLSILATYIAGFFGIKLKAEGPRKLLEILLKPKLLISAVLLNFVFYGAFIFYGYAKNGPVPIIVQRSLSKVMATPVSEVSFDSQIKVIKVKDGIFAKGVIVENKLYVGTVGGNLLKISLESGKIEDRFYIGKFVSPTPVFDNGYLYFGEGLHLSHGMGIYKFNLEKFDIESKSSTSGHTEIFPVISGDTIYQTSGGDGLYAFNTKDLTQKWQFPGGHMDGFPGIRSGELYVATGVPVEDNDQVRPFAYRLNTETGEVIWKKELPLSSWYGPTISENFICFTLGEIHVDSNLGGINCFSPNGDRVSTIFVDAPVLSKPIIVADNIIFNDYSGSIHSWSIDGQKENWSIASTSNVRGYSSLSMKNGILYFVNASGVLKKIDPLSGRYSQVDLKEKLSLGEKIYADILYHGDELIIFGMNGTILKLRQSEVFMGMGNF